ncbi:MAG: hypothetical protein SF051_04955 [Elusimicrobiota bacterium]|nr:hypothetical protein [Elusimicrobiota bacterium]
MPASYPAPKTGTAQDLMRVITRAYEAKLDREGTVLPHKSERGRRWLEPVARLFGIAVATVLSVLPAELYVAFHDRLYRGLAGGRVYPFDASSPAVRHAVELAARLAAETGREPALIAVISHPPVMGELKHLNFELVRHATLALRAVRGRPCRPRLVVAVDPFALDTTSLLEEGVYAGYMGTLHLGLDRLALGRGHLGPSLTPRTAWHAMPWRMLKLLGDGGEAGIVLSGGVPETGRVLYGAREWVREARAAARGLVTPAEAGERLEREPGFRAFVDGAGVPLPEGPWRRLEGWLMAAAVGLAPGGARETAARVLELLRVPASARPALLTGLEFDLSRETPRRLRLFRALAGRVTRRRPLIIIPIVHSVSPLGVEVREAWSWESAGRGRVKAGSAGEASREDAVDAHARRLVEGNFS